MRTTRFMTGTLVLLVISLLLACARDATEPKKSLSSGDEHEAPSLPYSAADDRMTLDAMDRIVRATAPDAERQGSVWAFVYLDEPVLIITDVNSNRMRVVSPVIEAADVSDEQWVSMFVANFHSALDARYAVSEGVVYSLFLHPFGSLTEADLRSAISQVVVLSKTFGSTYNSSALSFGSAETQ